MVKKNEKERGRDTVNKKDKKGSEKESQKESKDHIKHKDKSKDKKTEQKASKDSKKIKKASEKDKENFKKEALNLKNNSNKSNVNDHSNEQEPKISQNELPKSKEIDKESKEEIEANKDPKHAQKETVDLLTQNEEVSNRKLNKDISLRKCQGCEELEVEFALLKKLVSVLVKENEEKDKPKFSTSNINSQVNGHNAISNIENVFSTPKNSTQIFENSDILNELNKFRSLCESLTKEVKDLKDSSNRLRTGLHCSICMNYYTLPHALDCGHTFCLSCIKPWLESLILNNESLSCPLCRINVKKVPVFVHSLHSHLIETLRESEQTIETKEIIVRLVKAFDEFKNQPDINRWEKIFPKCGFNTTIRDDEDDVYRCTNCNWEVVGGHCMNCDRVYDRDDCNMPRESSEDSFTESDSDDSDRNLRDSLNISRKRNRSRDPDGLDAPTSEGEGESLGTDSEDQDDEEMDKDDVSVADSFIVEDDVVEYESDASITQNSKTSKKKRLDKNESKEKIVVEDEDIVMVAKQPNESTLKRNDSSNVGDSSEDDMSLNTKRKDNKSKTIILSDED